MKHTPTPWKADGKTIRIGSGQLSGFSMASCDCTVDTGESEANAEFIVRACNCHEELVEALEHLLDEFENITYAEFATQNNVNPCQEYICWQKTKQALAKATQ